MIAPKISLEKNNFNCFSYMNADTSQNTKKTGTAEYQGLPPRQVNDKPKSLPFVVDWQIDEQENHLGTTQ